MCSLHQSYCEMGLVSRSWKGPHRVGLLLRHTVVKCLFRAFSTPFFLPRGCHLAVPHLWVPQHRVSGQEHRSLYPSTKLRGWNAFKVLCKSIWCLWLWDGFVLSNLRKVFVFFSAQMEMVIQAKKNVINNTNWGPLGENFSFEKWLLCMNMSCHQEFFWIVLTLHICIYFSSAAHGPFSLFN